MQVNLQLYRDIDFEEDPAAYLDGKVTVNYPKGYFFIATNHHISITVENKIQSYTGNFRDYQNLDISDIREIDDKKIYLLEQLNRNEFLKAIEYRDSTLRRTIITPNSTSLKKILAFIDDYIQISLEWFDTNDLVPPMFDVEVIEFKNLFEWHGTTEQIDQLYKMLKVYFLDKNCSPIDFASFFQIDGKVTRKKNTKSMINFNGKQNELAYILGKLKEKKYIMNPDVWETTTKVFLVNGEKLNPRNFSKSYQQLPKSSRSLKQIIDFVVENK